MDGAQEEKEKKAPTFYWHKSISEEIWNFYKFDLKSWIEDTWMEDSQSDRYIIENMFKLAETYFPTKAQPSWGRL